MNILILHGPNLNLLGTREPETYGKLTLAQLNSRLKKFTKELFPRKPLRGVTKKSDQIHLRIFQSNHEGTLIDLLHRHRKWADGVVFNPAAYTHYSYALRDAVAAVALPVVEVHLTDIRKRESFRRVSVIAPVCVRQISGLGIESYFEGIRFLKTRLHGQGS